MPGRTRIALVASAALACTVAHADTPLPALDLIFDADGSTWVALADVPPESVTEHAPLRMVTEPGRLFGGGHNHTAIASVSAAQLPAAARAWSGREIVVEGACRAKLTEFALVARASGEPNGNEQGFDAWTPAHVMEKGKVVLAARLAHCRGVYAQPQPAAGAILRPFERIRAPAAAAKARALVLASQNVESGPAHPDAHGDMQPWKDSAAVDAIVARDPKTKTTWISEHVHSRGAPTNVPTVNVWAVYRVKLDGSVEEVWNVMLDNVDDIVDLVDIDGDGMPELAGVGAFGPGGIVVGVAGGDVHELFDVTSPSFSL